MNKRILVTLGPSSLKKEIISKMEKHGIHLFRINLSHTPLNMIEQTIKEIRKHTDIPICLDSEGAQMRNQKMSNGDVFFERHSEVKVHFNEVCGNNTEISFTPSGIVSKLKIGDQIKIDFNAACIEIKEINDSYALAEVIKSGAIGNNKAANLINREIPLAPITDKDRAAIAIGRAMGIKNFALSFAGSGEEVENFRKITGDNSVIISKIESKRGLLNLDDILNKSDEILIDRGDLSREIDLIKIPFMQRRILATALEKGVPVYVATNLLESMLKSPEPTRAEINDVVCSLRTGASGLVLAAETAIGKYPEESVRITRALMTQLEKWTPNSSVTDVLDS